jgi:hypothetical protein
MGGVLIRMARGGKARAFSDLSYCRAQDVKRGSNELESANSRAVYVSSAQSRLNCSMPEPMLRFSVQGAITSFFR